MRLDYWQMASYYCQPWPLIFVLLDMNEADNRTLLDC